MAGTALKDPVSRWTIQARLHATDLQWDELESHLERFEVPGGLIVFDWPAVVATVRRLAQRSRRRSSEKRVAP
jgi:hypothetical protein